MTRSNVGPPPTYNGSLEVGVFNDYVIKATIWLNTTNVKATARGPRLPRALTDVAFDNFKHLALDPEGSRSSTNGFDLLKLMSEPEQVRE